MDTLTAIQEGARRIKGVYVLTGTAALWARGYAVESGDVDFLVAEPQGPAQADPAGREEGSAPQSYREEIGGVKVDYIFADEVRRPYLTARPDVISGVAVASVVDVLEFKRFADRPKDREFLRRWRAGEVGPPVFVES